MSEWRRQRFIKFNFFFSISFKYIYRFNHLQIIHFFLLNNVDIECVLHLQCTFPFINGEGKRIVRKRIFYFYDPQFFLFPDHLYLLWLLLLLLMPMHHLFKYHWFNGFISHHNFYHLIVYHQQRWLNLNHWSVFFSNQIFKDKKANL